MNINAIVAKAEEILEHYGYDRNHHLEESVQRCVEAKQRLREILSNHPNWDDEHDCIVFDVDSTRSVDADNITEFFHWVYRNRDIDVVDSDDVEELIMSYKERFADEEYTEKANKILLKYGGKATVKPGMKVSRIVNMVCKLWKLDQIVNIKHEEYVDNHGVLHERDKDYGWNYQFARYADSINPFTVKRHTIISINYNDFLTMSIGDNWASCHTIDKENINDVGNGYHGEYSAGCLSYAMDKVSFVFYYVDNTYNGNDYQSQRKQKRCMFFYDHNKLIQSRVYPDGRDIGDFGISEEVRNIVQRVISECIDEPDLWTVKKGVSNVENHIRSRGYQYEDYYNYNDVTISFSKNHPITEDTLNIGSDSAKCICCGSTIEWSDAIYCAGCYNGITCDRCGDYISDGEDLRDYYGDYHYCCEDCANRDGWYSVNNSDYLVSEHNMFWDAYDGEPYEEDSDTIYTDYGTYANEDNAEADGLVATEDTNQWRRREDCEEIDGEWYEDPANAGFIWLEEEGEWVYGDYAENVDGVWKRKDA